MNLEDDQENESPTVAMMIYNESKTFLETNTSVICNVCHMLTSRFEDDDKLMRTIANTLHNEIPPLMIKAMMKQMVIMVTTLHNEISKLMIKLMMMNPKCLNQAVVISFM